MKARLKGDHSIHIISPDWVTACSEKQEKVSEELYDYQKFKTAAQMRNSSLASHAILPRHRQTRSSAAKPAHADSPSKLASSESQLTTSGKTATNGNGSVQCNKNEKALAGRRSSSCPKVNTSKSVVSEAEPSVTDPASGVQKPHEIPGRVLTEVESNRETRRPKSVVVKKEKMNPVFLLSGLSGTVSVRVFVNFRNPKPNIPIQYL